jgi:hypothetical protein
MQQVASAPSWRWRIGVTLTLNRPEKTRAFLGLLARIDGMVGTIRLPICAPGLTLRHPDEAGYRAGLPWTDGAEDRPWSSGEGWALPGRGYEFAVTASAAVGSNAITVPWDGFASLLLPGHHVTVGDDLHIVTAVYAEGSDSRIELHPPLRRTHPVGTAFYTRATGIFRLATPDVPRLAQSLGRFGSISINMIEAWERV